MTLEELIELVHERDVLVGERDDLDEKIRLIEARLSQVAGFANGQTSGTPKEAVHPSSPLGSLSVVPLPEGGFLSAFRSGTSVQASSHTDRVLAAIRASGGHLDYGVVARDLYGEDTVATRKRLRSILSALNQDGRISNVGRNQWQINVATAGGAAVT
jgi:hypothetical protein